jgi:putative transposase
MNTDQGSQFTSFDWTDRLKRAKTKISMDGKARYLDNIFASRTFGSSSVSGGP